MDAVSVATVGYLSGTTSQKKQAPNIGFLGYLSYPSSLPTVYDLTASYFVEGSLDATGTFILAPVPVEPPGPERITPHKEVIWASTRTAGRIGRGKAQVLQQSSRGTVSSKVTGTGTRQGSSRSQPKSGISASGAVHGSTRGSPRSGSGSGAVKKSSSRSKPKK